MRLRRADRTRDPLGAPAGIVLTLAADHHQAACPGFLGFDLPGCFHDRHGRRDHPDTCGPRRSTGLRLTAIAPCVPDQGRANHAGDTAGRGHPDGPQAHRCQVRRAEDGPRHDARRRDQESPPQGVQDTCRDRVMRLPRIPVLPACHGRTIAR
jgi:hypothetical protein